ncbi:MAG: 16S rRNA (cytidine(1402)-2'-O)-methyltransferase [Minisyncoccia bacterium]|jgi:16S rRNA (cytidine1402-2'-O)-methyltransferase
MATLYVVGTPIGNLEDVTLRALKVLASVDLILCEDTRVTRRLLERHSIKTKTLSYHAHSKLSRVDEIIGLLKEGKTLALVSDAGTPGISDPGTELVARIRESLSGEISQGRLKIESVPGPSGLTAALSVAGVPCADFTFLGFLPHKKGRETLFREIAASERTVVFYESPHRIMKTLGSLTSHLKDAPDKRVTVCRELSKVFEEVVGGTASEVLACFKSDPGTVRGEFVVIVSLL